MINKINNDYFKFLLVLLLLIMGLGTTPCKSLAATSELSITFEKQKEVTPPILPPPPAAITPPAPKALPQMSDFVSSIIVILLGVSLVILAVSIVALKKIIMLQERNI